MPVLPLVGSITVSLLIHAVGSAASIIATPMRSLTLPSGIVRTCFLISSAAPVRRHA